MFRPLLIWWLAVMTWWIPRTGEAADRLLLVLAETATNRSVEATFVNEIALVLDDIRVVLIPGKRADFKTLAERDRIAAAHEVLKARGALALVWMERSAASATAVERIGLLVHTDSGTLARTVSFENPILFLPELALITGELIAHALVFEPDRPEGGTAEGATEASTDAALSESPVGLGRRIPAPDGWTRVPEAEAGVTGPDAQDDGVAGDTAPQTEAPEDGAGEAAADEDAAKGEAASGEGKEANQPAVAPKGEPDKTGKGSPERRAAVADRRRFSLAPLFELAQGFGGHTGSTLWMGGGGTLSFWPTPALFLALDLGAQGGPLPKKGLVGWRLLPSVSMGYLFPVGQARFGPVVNLAMPRTSIAIGSPDYNARSDAWWGFRAALGARLVAPTNRRVALDLVAFIGTHAGTKAFVNAQDDTELIYKTPLGELFFRAGLLVFL